MFVDTLEQKFDGKKVEPFLPTLSQMSNISLTTDRPNFQTSLGEVRSSQEDGSGGHSAYRMMVNDLTVIDGINSGHPSRFINQSCEPNLECQRWCVGDHTRVGFFAARDIERGAELTFDYDFESGGFKCNCGAATCKGWVGKRWMLVLDFFKLLSYCRNCKQASVRSPIPFVLRGRNSLSSTCCASRVAAEGFANNETIEAVYERLCDGKRWARRQM